MRGAWWVRIADVAAAHIGHACWEGHLLTGPPFGFGAAGSAREFAVRSMNAERWPAHLEATPALDLFPRESLVLLSPDAEIPLDSLDPAKVGGRCRAHCGCGALGKHQ